MDTILTTISNTVPALIVFLTVYFLMKHFFEHQTKIRLFEMDDAKKGASLPQRILAYERLTLFCERIRLPNLLMRLSSSDDKAEGVLHALLISVQKEYEHNITQQIYVSENLWKIISLAKNDILNLINQVYAECEEGTSDAFRRQLLSELHKMEISPVEQALSAIHSEAKLYLS